MPDQSCDCIAAIATAAGDGGVGIIRIAGAGAHRVAARAWRGRLPEPGAFAFGQVIAADGELLDEGLLLLFRGPHSYTGDDVAELQCHGGTVSLGRCLAAVLAAGARPARAGEFTERAFVNGRLDLTQAEAVMDLVRSRSDGAARQAIRQLAGALGAAAAALREQAMRILVELEAFLDYPEEVDEPRRDDLSARLTAVAERATALAGTFQRGRLVREGLCVAIVGRPNVGKSSLLNALAGEERAIVTAEPGTTRDAVRDWIEVDGVAVEVVDTAGLRAGGGEIERLGMDRSRRWMERADLVLAVFDGSMPLTDEDRAIIAALDAPRTLIVLNKADRGECAASVSALRAVAGVNGVVPASAVAPDGTRTLRAALAQAVRAGAAGEVGAVATRERHWQALTAAATALSDGAGAAAAGMPLDLLTVDLRRALQALGELTGETVREEVIARIFAEFCVGK